MIVGIDHGYYAIKTKHVSFPSGIIEYDYEPYTMQNVLQYRGKYYVCGTGRQTLVKNKTSNDNYYLLTLAAIAEEIKNRKAERKTEVILAVGLPLSSFGREKQGFKEYLLRKEQPVRFLYESEWYEIQIKDVKLFPQGYSALALHPEYDEREKRRDGDAMRKRNHVIPVRLNARELRELEEQVEKSGLSREEFMRSLILGAQVHAKPCEHHPELLRKIAGLCNNANQLAHVANASGMASEQSVQEMLRLTKETWHLVKEEW